jgi:hypothetical protein
MEIAERLPGCVAHDEELFEGAAEIAAQEPFSLAPLFLGFPLHRRRCAVFNLDPMFASAGTIGRPEPLRHNALAAERASVLEDDRAVALKMFIEGDTRMGFAHQAGERALARLDRKLAQIVAVQLQKVERAMDGGCIGPLPPDQVEDGKPVFVAHDHLAINQAGARLQARHSRDNKGKSASEIVAVASNEPHAGGIASCQESEAVVLDLVNPTCARRRRFCGGRETGLDEAAMAITQQNHAV